MADEGTVDEQQHDECAPVRASVRVEFVPAEKLPPGALVVPLTAPGTLVWGVREGEMTDALREEMNHYLEHIIGSGLWQQNWAGDDTTPPPTQHPH